MITDEQIRELAYYIWQKEGCPEGKATEHYFRAKQMLEAEESMAQNIIELPPPYSGENILDKFSTPKRKRSHSRSKH
jgi:hypothetical protein